MVSGGLRVAARGGTGVAAGLWQPGSRGKMDPDGGVGGGSNAEGGGGAGPFALHPGEGRRTGQEPGQRGWPEDSRGSQATPRWVGEGEGPNSTPPAKGLTPSSEGQAGRGSTTKMRREQLRPAEPLGPESSWRRPRSPAPARPQSPSLSAPAPATLAPPPRPQPPSLPAPAPATLAAHPATATLAPRPATLAPRPGPGHPRSAPPLGTPGRAPHSVRVSEPAAGCWQLQEDAPEPLLHVTPRPWSPPHLPPGPGPWQPGPRAPRAPPRLSCAPVTTRCRQRSWQDTAPPPGPWVQFVLLGRGKSATRTNTLPSPPPLAFDERRLKTTRWHLGPAAFPTVSPPAPRSLGEPLQAALRGAGAVRGLALAVPAVPMPTSRLPVRLGAGGPGSLTPATRSSVDSAKGGRGSHQSGCVT
nr:uncharacterized protein LOC127484827 [Oryctolagus cuniculus]